MDGALLDLGLEEAGPFVSVELYFVFTRADPRQGEVALAILELLTEDGDLLFSDEDTDLQVESMRLVLVIPEEENPFFDKSHV